MSRSRSIIEEAPTDADSFTEGRAQTMTTSIAQRATRTGGTATPRPAVQRFTASIASFAEIMLDAIEASRAIQTAQTPEARRVVVDRFSAESTRHAHRTAA